MEQQVLDQLTEFNQAYKEVDKIYHQYATAHGLSDAVFGVLYALREHGTAYPQSELCRDWSYTPQTANSAVKSLEKQGLVKLVFAKGNRKNKEIRFTAAGQALAKKIIDPLMQAERVAFSGLNGQERSALLSAMQKHIALFKNETNSALSRTVHT